jgi:hypothetical protein
LYECISGLGLSSVFSDVRNSRPLPGRYREVLLKLEGGKDFLISKNRIVRCRPFEIGHRWNSLIVLKRPPREPPISAFHTFIFLLQNVLLLSIEHVLGP